MSERTFAAGVLTISAGVMVWAAHFALIYGFTALACARGLDGVQWLGVGVIAWVVLAATLVAVALIVWRLAPLRRAHADFIEWLGAALAGLALIGVVYEAVPLALVTPCN